MRHFFCLMLMVSNLILFKFRANFGNCGTILTARSLLQSETNYECGGSWKNSFHFSSNHLLSYLVKLEFSIIHNHNSHSIQK